MARDATDEPAVGAGQREKTGDVEEAAMIEAAYRKLAADRSSSVSVSDILDATGLGTRAFYRHFPSKDALLLAMFRRDSERVTSQLAGLVAAAPDASAALEEWVGFQLALCYDPRRFRRVQVMMSDEVRRSPGYAQAQHDVAADQRALLVAILERGRGEGSLPDGDPELDARAIQAITGRLIEERSRNVDTLEWPEAKRYVLGFARRALGARDRVPPPRSRPG
jgi:AcrR family transcriptional regulator